MSYNFEYYIHESDRAAFNALKAIPGFTQLIKGFMKIWYEKEYKILNMSSYIKASEVQFAKYYNMLPAICEKLGIAIPELYIKLDVNPNSYTYGDTNPFIVITSGLFETLPDELISTVLAHECGHIACHHTLYRTMGSILLNGTSNVLSYIPFGSVLSLPMMVAFFYWMRCSELSADRAAVLCDGSAEKMSEVCLRLAGYDKDIDAVVDIEEFLRQAIEYKEMINNSKWNKTLEFFILLNQDHPLTAVRALECTEWAKQKEFFQLLEGTYQPRKEQEDKNENKEDAEKKILNLNPLGFLFKQNNESEKNNESITEKMDSIPTEIREYKALLDDGIITQEEFESKKKQLLDI